MRHTVFEARRAIAGVTWAPAFSFESTALSPPAAELDVLV
jgi:hypothetical protein